jgi:hypothetical protein
LIGALGTPINVAQQHLILLPRFDNLPAHTARNVCTRGNALPDNGIAFYPIFISRLAGLAIGSVKRFILSGHLAILLSAKA